MFKNHMEQFMVSDLKTTGEGLGLQFVQRKSKTWFTEVEALNMLMRSQRSKCPLLHRSGISRSVQKIPVSITQ